MTGAKSQATILVELVLAHPDLELFHGPDHRPYAYLPVDDHFETWPIRSRAFKRWMAGLFFEQLHKAPGSQATADALAVLESRALFEGLQRDVHVRIAEWNEAIYIDLGCPHWHVVEITTKGWEVHSKPPVRFRRPSGMQALPHPDHVGTIEDLRAVVNIADADWPVFLGVMVGIFNPNGPYAVLNLLGEQGSAKTTTCRVMRSLVDPSAAPVRTSPRSERDLMVAATSSWITVIDNLSSVPDWLSDAIARLSTGGGLATRELYTDDEPYLFDACRPVLMNGITDVITRPDLLDRSVILSVPRLETHRNERDLWSEFEEMRAGILGVLLDGVAGALKNLPTVQRHGLPRMADFCRWAMAAMPALSQTPEAFLKAYKANRANVNRLALEASPVAEAVLKFMQNREEWSGISAELLEALNEAVVEAVRRDDRDWPRSARGLSGHLRRVAPNLRRQGIEIVFPDRSNTARTLRLERVREQPSQPSQPPSPQVDRVTVGVTVEPAIPQPSPQKPRSEPRRDGSDRSDGRMQAQSSPEEDEEFEQEEDLLAALKAGLGAVESETVDHIRERRCEGADFTTITAELNRNGFPPPPWRARWELQDTVEVYGWRR